MPELLVIAPNSEEPELALEGICCFRRAGSGREALRALRSATTLPAAILLSADLPNASALETLARLRQHPWTSAIPLLWLGSGPEALPEGEAGPDLCLPKTADPADLRRAVRTLLRLRPASADAPQPEAEFRALFEMAAVGIGQGDATTLTLQRANRKFCEITGYSEAELQGKPFLDITHPDDRARDAATILRVLRGKGRGWRSEKRYVRKDGEIVWVQVDGTFVPGPDGRPGHALAIVQDISERKRTEQALRQSEATQRSLLDNTPSMMGVVELAPDDSDILHVLDNAYSEWFFGVERGGTAGKWARRDLGTSPEAIREWSERYREAQETGQPVRFLFRPERDDPETAPVWLDVSVSPMGPGSDGRDRFCYTALDDTERRRAEAALRESEERLLFALEAGRLGAWEWNIQTGRVAWSQGLEPLHGLEPGSFEGTYEAFLKLVHPDEQERIVRALDEALKGEAPYELEFRSAHPAGITQWIATQAQVHRDEEGRPVRMVGVTRDITAEKLAELGRRESEAKFRNIVEAANEGIWLLDAEARVTFANPRLEEMLGYTREEMLGREKWDFLFEEDQPQGRALFERRRQGISEQVDFRFRHRDGHEVWTLMAARALMDEKGRLTEVLDLFTDITERKRAEETLRLENRRKTEFLAMLAHELRNPLTPVVNAVELLRLQDRGDPNVRRHRETIERNARHLTRLVDDLLEVSRINEGKISLRKERVELRQWVEQAVSTVRSQVDAREQRLRVSLPDEPVTMEADATRLVQVLVNLLKNASKYTGHGGEISVKGAREGDQVVVRVRDTGRGMAPELLARAFDLFVQGEQDLARTEGGLGVGLTLVRHLVELHGGTVTASSEGPGRGSEFTVRIPAELGLREESGAPERGSASDGRGRRVLVVEDNTDAAATLEELLRHWGHEVRVALSGRAALDLAPQFRPDVILLDIGLPDLDGYEVARLLQDSGALGQVFLAALTGYGDHSHRERVAAAGFDDHLTKPIDPDSLRRLLDALTVTG